MQSHNIKVKEKALAWLHSKGLTEVNFSANGRCVIRNDQGQECLLWIPENSNILHIFIHLETLDPQIDMAVLVFAMSLNLDVDRTGELKLGYNPDSHQLIASVNWDLSMTESKGLDERIVTLLERTTSIKEEIETFRLHQPANPPSPFSTQRSTSLKQNIIGL